MDTQVKITLKALTSNVSPAERVIILNPNRPTIPIGRASKSVSKGLLSAVDNAWFDSPVMSRDHAKISMNAEDKNITIQDIGSMHGTYLNEYELPRKTAMAIDDGDIVVFGAEVRRGPETFPACKFQVNYEFGPYKSANTFAFPDSSDVEDEEAYDDFSEDSMGENDPASSEDSASVESPPAKVSKAIAPIDLTGDESPLVFPSNRIDLTGESSLEQGLMDMMEGRPANMPHDANSASITVYAEETPIILDSEDEDAHLSIDSDEQSDMIEDDVSSESDSQDEVEDSEQSEEEVEAEDSDLEMEPTDDSNIDNDIRFALATHDISNVPLSDIRGRILESPNAMDDDEESDFGLSEAGEAGIRALFEDGLLRHSYDDPYPVPGEMRHENGMGNTLHIQNPKHITFEPPPTIAATQDSSPSVPQTTSEISRFQAAQSTLRHELKLSDPVARQPSPSDAAMAKSNVPGRDSARVGVCALGDFGKPAEQTLGEKTGKGDFFEARAFNKAKFNAINKSGPVSSIDLTGTNGPVFTGNLQSSGLQQTIAFTNPFAPRQKEGSFGVSQSPKPSTSPAFTFGESSYPVHQASSAVNKLSPADITYFSTREQCSFLDNPAHGPGLERAPSPEPYMTSAVNFNAATHKPRSGLGINDIINNASTTTNSLKRKADDISDATDAELRIWAQSSTASNDNMKVSEDVPASEVQNLAPSAEPEDVSAALDAPAPRPTKKLKKLLENVGYAALGGVAVGAGLFSVLVATAPDFL